MLRIKSLTGSNLWPNVCIGMLGRSSVSSMIALTLILQECNWNPLWIPTTHAAVHLLTRATAVSVRMDCATDTNVTACNSCRSRKSFYILSSSLPLLAVIRRQKNFCLLKSTDTLFLSSFLPRLWDFCYAFKHLSILLKQCLPVSCMRLSPFCCELKPYRFAVWRTEMLSFVSQ